MNIDRYKHLDNKWGTVAQLHGPISMKYIYKIVPIDSDKAIIFGLSDSFVHQNKVNFNRFVLNMNRRSNVFL